MSSKFTLQELVAKIPVMAPHEHLSVDEVFAKFGPNFTFKGKTVLVTGGSAGIGVETVRGFASKGARVFVGVRDVEKTKKILEDIAAAHPDHGGLEILKLDLESLASVKAAATDFLRRSSQLNVLVGNAGVMNTPYQLTPDGHEYQFGVNHLGHYLLFKSLLPVLLKSSTSEFNSRVICLSSRGHLRSGVDLSDLHWKKRGYSPPLAYAQSKTANILMAYEIERRYGSQGLHAWAVHPGGINTDLSRHTTPEDFVSSGLFTKDGELAVKMVLKSVAQGAATTVWAAAAPELEGKGGKYCEDVHIAEPVKEGVYGGVAPHAYDGETALRLWEYSDEAIKAFL